MIRIAIDPGEKHVGVATDQTGKLETMELRPPEFLEWLDMTLFVLAEPLAPETRLSLIEVVVESFKLYPGQDRRVTFRKMATSELIGAIKMQCLRYGVPIVEQDATIKKPTRAQLRGRGIRQVGSGTHERDAELHYYHRRLRRELPVAKLPERNRRLVQTQGRRTCWVCEQSIDEFEEFVWFEGRPAHEECAYLEEHDR